MKCFVYHTYNSTRILLKIHHFTSIDPFISKTNKSKDSGSPPRGFSPRIGQSREIQRIREHMKMRYSPGIRCEQILRHLSHP
jgi:hypothetical protein